MNHAADKFGTPSAYLKLTLSGILISMVISAFLFTYGFVNKWYQLGVDKQFYWIIIFVVGTIAASVLEYFLLDKSLGKGEVGALHLFYEGKKKWSWIFTLLRYIVIYAITYMIGLPLGPEGPSIFLGALIGGGVCYFLSDKGDDDLKGIRLGASAGFAVAYSNPLVGITFYFEEMRKKFELKRFLYLVYLVGISVGFSYLAKYFLSLVSGEEIHLYLYELFNDNIWYLDAWPKYGVLAICIVASFFVAYAFRFAYEKLEKFKDCKYTKIYVIASIVMAAATCVAIRFTWPDLLGAGSSRILYLHQYTTPELLAIFGIRFAWTILAFASFYAGGRPIPSLVMGATLGSLIAGSFSSIVPMSDSELMLTELVTMLSFFLFLNKGELKLTIIALSFSFGLPWVLGAYVIPIVGLYWLFEKFVLKRQKEYDERD
ncbi:MAG: chloride channel protein [Bacilli bacterium]|nr:chloride channel protein [Bacilli bacterium]